MTSEEIILKNEHLIINETLQLLRDIKGNQFCIYSDKTPNPNDWKITCTGTVSND